MFVRLLLTTNNYILSSFYSLPPSYPFYIWEPLKKNALDWKVYYVRNINFFENIQLIISKSTHLGLIIISFSFSQLSFFFYGRFAFSSSSSRVGWLVNMCEYVIKVFHGIHFLYVNVQWTFRFFML